MVGEKDVVYEHSFAGGGQMVLINVRNHLVYFVCAWNLVGIWFACFDV